MRWSSRERELQRRAAKKDLIVHKSPIDGTLMVDLRAYVPVFPETIKTKPWGKRSKIHPPMEEIYEAATLREAEQFVKQYVPPWSRKCDPDVAASVANALEALARASRSSRKQATSEVVLNLSKMPTRMLEWLFGPWERNRRVH